MTNIPPVGPALDALIAREVFGFEDVRLYPHPHGIYCAAHYTPSGKIIPVPNYSTSWDGLGLLWHKLQELGYRVIWDDEGLGQSEIILTYVWIYLPGNVDLQAKEPVTDSKPAALAVCAARGVMAREGKS